MTATLGSHVLEASGPTETEEGTTRNRNNKSQKGRWELKNSDGGSCWGAWMSSLRVVAGERNSLWEAGCTNGRTQRVEAEQQPHRKPKKGEGEGEGDVSYLVSNSTCFLGTLKLDFISLKNP